MRYFEGRWVLEVSNFITDYYPYFHWVGIAWGFPGGSTVKNLPAMQEWSESCSVVSNSLWLHGLYSPWNSSGQNTGVGSLSLLQGIFPNQRSNPGLPHCRRIIYQLSHKGSPCLNNDNVSRGSPNTITSIIKSINSSFPNFLICT